jgi:2-hydroxymuconate-semialdehyde hydrolase
MTDDDIIVKLTSFFRTEILEGAEIELAPSTPLLEFGLLNSMSVLLLLDHIEKTFAVTIAREDIKPENLKDLSTIAALVRRAHGQTKPGA